MFFLNFNNGFLQTSLTKPESKKTKAKPALPCFSRRVQIVNLPLKMRL